MKNAIVGERLKGLYHSCMSISAKTNLEKKLKGMLLKLVEFSKNIAEKEFEDSDLASIVLTDSVNLMKNSSKCFYNKDSLTEELKRMKNIIILKINTLGDNIKHTVSQKEMLLKAQSNLALKLESFNEEYSRSRLKLVEVMEQNSKNFMNAPKVCEKCKIVYTEKDNLNWSCTTHSAE